MTLAMLSLLVSVATGVLLVELFWSRDRRGLDDLWLKLALGAGLGPGVGGALAFLVTLAFGFSRSGIITADILALVVVAALVFRRRFSPAPEVPAKRNASPPLRARPASSLWQLLWVPFVVLLAAEAWAMFIVARTLPQGAWDAWAFWDLRAKYLMQSPPDQWAQAFSAVPGLIGFHPDYPPLFPFIIARSWSWGETLAPGVTLAVATLYTFGVVALVVAALRSVASLATALIAGMILLGTPTFLRQGGWRLADVPLAWFMLATVALITIAESRGEKSRGLLVLAGIACGLAALTKNEGILFAAITGSAFVIATWFFAGRERRLGDILSFTAGIAVPLALLVYFKARLAPGMDLLGPEGTKGALPFSSPAKHYAILEAFVAVFFSTEYWCAFPWALVVAVPLLGFRFPSRVRRAAFVGAAVFLLMLAGYYAVYATTRHEVGWLLSTTIFRLLVQVAPIGVFVAFLFTRSPEGEEPAAASR